MSYGGLGVHPSASKTFDNDYQSPSLNKSVSFSQQVRVREFPSNSHNKNHSPLRNANAHREDMPARRLSYGKDSLM